VVDRFQRSNRSGTVVIRKQSVRRSDTGRASVVDEVVAAVDAGHVIGHVPEDGDLALQLGGEPLVVVVQERDQGCRRPNSGRRPGCGPPATLRNA
jgi:hypothetical protein